uniref:Uncharacterized protein n=1 Tax=Rhizophora mucronata TaxID=61149 RepID=A0A2P2NWH2_RHIMU
MTCISNAPVCLPSSSHSASKGFTGYNLLPSSIPLH